ncbi:MAG: cupin domain-containing protein [Chloroflexi bacterium]|nr:cupin domain-containing protein [Chloroflexota bacterium]MCL5074887.1 cupin domain-containing protein [Chloroflexota bacterium]
MEYTKISEIKEFSAERFLKKVPLTTEKIVFNAFNFRPRQILPLHKHPTTDELFYVIEGTGEVTIGNEQRTIGPTSVIYGPADVWHGIVNAGEDDMVVISVQAPKPVEMVYAENSTVICPVCKQEVILKVDTKEGDLITCPRCQARLKLSRVDGKWTAVQA